MPSKVPSVEVVKDFDVVKRVTSGYRNGWCYTGVTLDPVSEEVERECANLSDDEEGVGQSG